MSRFIKAIAMVAVAALTLVACGDDDDNQASSEDVEATTTTTTAPQAAVYSADEYTIEGPDTAAAGTSEITLDNLGTIDHSLVIFQVDSAHADWTEAQVAEFVRDDPFAEPAWAVPVAAIDPPVAPGATGTAAFLDFSSGRDNPTVVPEGSLESGTYFLVCFEGDPPFHAGQGEVKKVTVT